MTLNEINVLFDRLARLLSATNKKSGSGTEWSYTFPDGETHKYIIHNIKAPSEIEDHLFNLIIWIWNAKDYLKSRVKLKGHDPQLVEHSINRDHYLSVCGDLANGLKHGNLKKSRSAIYPRFGKIRFIIKQDAIKSLTFRAFKVEVDVSQPNNMIFEMPIMGKNNNQVGEAFDYALQAIASLEKLRDQIENLA